MDKWTKAVRKAEEILNNGERDAAHDLQHHKDVWKTAQEIVQAEHPQIHKELLRVAVFWHDVVIDTVKWPSRLNVEETCQYLADLLPSIGFNEKETQVVVQSVLHHEFRDSPTMVEGLILQDADKLEALSRNRWDRTLVAYQSGAMEKETFLAYMRTFLKWAPILSATFHYPCSRKSAEESIHTFWTDPEWEETYTRFGLGAEYLQARSEKDSKKHILMRAGIRGKNWVLRCVLLR